MLLSLRIPSSRKSSRIIIANYLPKPILDYENVYDQKSLVRAIQLELEHQEHEEGTRALVPMVELEGISPK